MPRTVSGHRRVGGRGPSRLGLRSTISTCGAGRSSGVMLGGRPGGTWATSWREALRRLGHLVDAVLPVFGPHEDVMLSSDWHLAHSVSWPYLNVGLLLPGEVCDVADLPIDGAACRSCSAEGFIRQVIGWREYVWGRYWLWMPGYRDSNACSAPTVRCRRCSRGRRPYALRAPVHGWLGCPVTPITSRG